MRFLHENMIIDLIATAVLSLLVVIWLKERVLYVIFPWAYVQNFILAWAYTSGWVGKEGCRALLISKEFLLLWLFLYFLRRVPLSTGGPWLTPVRILGAFTAWCALRYAIAVVLQGQSLFGNLWNLRMACFPFEILVVAVGVASTRTQFARLFIRNMVLLVALLAAVGIVLDVVPGVAFWHDHVNIASYNYDVKADSSESVESGNTQDIQAVTEGVTGNGIERVAFSSFSPFRAFGTVGDAVGFGHFVAFPILLLAFWLRRSWKTRLMLLVVGVALLLSLTRSAWIFAAIAVAYVLVRERRYRLIFGLAGTGALAFSAWMPLSMLSSGTLVNFSTSSTDPHAQGLFWFYTQGLWELKNVFGQGMAADVPESGYGILLIRYGLPAVAILIWFCFALYRRLRCTHLRDKPLFVIAQAVPLALLVILNFSYYPFSFIPYLLVWFVIGFCLAVPNVIVPARSVGTRVLVKLEADAT